MNERKRWYELPGMALNIEKTSIIGFGFTPDPVRINNIAIAPVTSFKFLGLTIDQSFSLDQHVNSVSAKVRAAAAKIRADGANFSTRDRRRLYMGWVQGTLCSNGAAYLPLLNKTQLDSLQSASNYAIRSVVKLPRRSIDISITDVRQKLNIMSIRTLANKAILTQAWKDRAFLRPTYEEGPSTRSRSNGNVPHPDQKGILGKMIRTKALLAFNHLPITCKDEDSEGKAKRIIIEIAKKHPVI